MPKNKKKEEKKGGGREIEDRALGDGAGETFHHVRRPLLAPACVTSIYGCVAGISGRVDTVNDSTASINGSTSARRITTFINRRSADQWGTGEQAVLAAEPA